MDLHAQLGATLRFTPGVLRRRPDKRARRPGNKAGCAQSPVRVPTPTPPPPLPEPGRLESSARVPPVAVVVPFRDQAEQGRAAQLEAFLKMMPAWLGLPGSRVVVAVQPDDGRKFNRGLLLNAGVQEASRLGFQTVILHDVDLLPSDDLRPYYVAPLQKGTALHIGSRWGRYSYPGYLGGVLKVGVADYTAANGFPNTFWGWGGEDDAFAHRLRAMRIRTEAPSAGVLRDLEAGAPASARASTRIRDGGRYEWRNMTRREDLARDRAWWASDGILQLRSALAPRVLLDTPGCIKVEVDSSHFAKAPPPGTR